MQLSKSDFKVARTCGTKLYYRKLGYPSAKDDNPYLEFLADGGYMVETIAKLLFPNGREIGFDAKDQGVAETMSAVQADRVTLFEATLKFGNLLARVDILEKNGNQFRLIEVKAKGFDSVKDGPNPFRGARGGILASWQEYLEDVTFQVHVLQSLFPAAVIHPHLCLVDKAVSCTEDVVYNKFLFVPRQKSEDPKAFTRPQVTFTGDQDALRQAPIVKIVNASSEVAELMPVVRLSAKEFSESIAGNEPSRIPPVLQVGCKKCEYRDVVGENGFKECWGALAKPSPHLLDFYRVDALGKNGEVAARMIKDGHCALTEISVADLRGKLGERQKIQLEWTRKNQEFISPHLQDQLRKRRYPLHFIDFEASRMAVPYHAGMRPYEQVCFQWSCHTISSQGSDLTHQDWINLTDAYPNFEFGKSLRRALSSGGTVFVWSHFEKTALKDIREQMIKYKRLDTELGQWLDTMVADTGPIVDLYDLAKEYYFHPLMNGSLSIKDVLPAIWSQSDAVRNHPWFSAYLRIQNGRLLEPYETLEPLPFGDEEEEDMAQPVREGTGAMRTYQEMLYGLNKSNAAYREGKKALLLNYCKLDTAAMVMIWMHWVGRQ